MNVNAYLSDHLALASKNKCMFVLHIDAGNFGSLRLHFLPLVRPSSDNSIEIASAVSTDTIMIAQRVRWLSVAIPALARQGVSTVSIPSDIQRSLVQLKSIPLTQLSRVPVSLLPHLKVLAQLLDTPTCNLMSGMKNRTTFQKQKTFDIAGQGEKISNSNEPKEIAHE